MIQPRTSVPAARALGVWGADFLLNACAALRARWRREPFVDEGAGAGQGAWRPPLNLRELSSSWLAHRVLRRGEAAVEAELADGGCGTRALGELSDRLHVVERVAELRGSRAQALVARRGRARHEALAARVVRPQAGEPRLEAAVAGKLAPASFLNLSLATGTSAASQTRFQTELTAAERRLMQRMQKLGKGMTTLELRRKDLDGMSAAMLEPWRCTLGRDRFKVRVDRGAFDLIMAFAHPRRTREKTFEAYFGMFGPEDDEAALEVLRIRQRLAQTMGYACWADFELASLTLSRVGQCDAFLDACYAAWQPQLVPALERMRGAAQHARSAYGGEVNAATDQVDELYALAVDRGEANDWKLTEELKAQAVLPRILLLAGEVFQVEFRPATLAVMQHGWSSNIQAYEVKHHRGFLGYLYLDAYERWHQTLFGRRVEQAKAVPVASGHVYLALNFQRTGFGSAQVISWAEVTCIMHELGHVVHYLQSPHSPAEYMQLPLDLQETPAVLAEMAIFDARAVQRLAPAADARQVRSSLAQRDVFFFLHLLQNIAALHAMHAATFNAETATAADLRRTLCQATQRFSPMPVHAAFHPFGRMTGIHLAQSAAQIAYLFAYGTAEGYLAGARARAPRAFPPSCLPAVGPELMCRRFPAHALETVAGRRAGRLPPHPFAAKAGQHPSALLQGLARRGGGAAGADGSLGRRDQRQRRW